MNGIMEESLVTWTWNGAPQPPILCTAGDEEAMLTGRLITGGLVRSPACIHGVACCGGVWHAEGETREGAGDPLGRLKALGKNASDCTVSLQRLEELCDQVMAQDHAAGLHSILLCDDEKTVIGRDVGRHNALDKAVGKALREGLRLDHAALCSSGRLSLEMFAKAVMAGIPILATRKQVGSLCVACAAEMDVAVCRTGRDPICFSASWRVT